MKGRYYLVFIIFYYFLRKVDPENGFSFVEQGGNECRYKSHKLMHSQIALHTGSYFQLQENQSMKKNLEAAEGGWKKFETCLEGGIGRKELGRRVLFLFCFLWRYCGV